MIPSAGPLPAGSDPAHGRLAGTTALVTGGLGGVLATALGDAGADLVLTGRNRAGLASLRDRLAARGIASSAVPADLTDPDAALRVTRTATELFGGIDLLVNCIGVAGPHGQNPDADWWHTTEVNLHATVRAVVPGMIARGRGRVVNVVSAAGRHRWPGASAYSVSKAAVIKLTENLAQEAPGRGVTAFAFHPGLLHIGITAAHLARGQVGDPTSDHIWAWLRQERDTGGFTCLDSTVDAFLLLSDGTADPLSGHYLTTDDIFGLREEPDA
ncbi:SDR family NAD(P)-dependent oxidoreductase [Spirillospora sp. NPDC048911]|uniref:SDR family NAD(P)-dependent oxidoreductase n=1 Tax=Spirillospora sp. NPDC048911 TaxID=3364527 RepID=UPI0037190EB4